MSEANKRGTLPPDKLSVLYKQSEIIESLADLNRTLIDILTQHINVEEYEIMLSRILNGDDVIIE